MEAIAEAAIETGPPIVAASAQFMAKQLHTHGDVDVDYVGPRFRVAIHLDVRVGTLEALGVVINRIGSQGDDRAIPRDQVLNICASDDRPCIHVPVDQSQPSGRVQVCLHKGTVRRIGLGHVPIEPRQRRCEAQAVVGPETHPAAELDAICLDLGRVTFHQARMKVLRAIQPPHVPLQSRLPADGEASERLRVADIAGTSELGDGQRRIGAFSERKLAGGPEIGGRDPVIAAEDCQGFDASADRVAELTCLRRRDLALRGSGEQRDQYRADCRNAVRVATNRRAGLHDGLVSHRPRLAHRPSASSAERPPRSLGRRPHRQLPSPSA